MKEEVPYNPLHKQNLGISVAEAMLAQPIHPLPPKEPFKGAGIYALYYTGPYSPYEPISSQNREGKYALPIYVGKAVPKGARTGGVGFDSAVGTALFGRITQHANSIKGVSNLELSDFACRYLVVDDIWIPLGESLLIEMFSPIWNKVIAGFGNNDPGRHRYGGQPSLWDVLHPGRRWAEKFTEKARDQEPVLQKLAAFFERRPPEEEKDKPAPFK